MKTQVQSFSPTCEEFVPRGLHNMPSYNNFQQHNDTPYESTQLNKTYSMGTFAEFSHFAQAKQPEPTLSYRHNSFTQSSPQTPMN